MSAQDRPKEFFDGPISSHDCCADRDCPGPDVTELADAIADRIRLATVATIPAEILKMFLPGYRTSMVLPGTTGANQVIVEIRTFEDHLELALTYNGYQPITTVRFAVA
ncbi:MAG TPA: hypothetical protein VGH11_13490 [Jatrophihabitans sp.]